uniref:Uncharacterized protein n=1 Tax=Neogobius melanostomus TaxID=47308 RepID=A0A8C6VAK6_9GOBI
MKKDLIVKQHGIRLLEAQIATGGIIDPLKCLHLPLDVACKKGYFDEEMIQILKDPTDDTKGFFFPKTLENLTYLEMLKRCVKDEKTGLYLLPLSEEPKAKDTSTKVYTLEEKRHEFKKISVNVKVGLISTIEKLENSETPQTVMGLRKPVSARQLLECKIIDEETFKKIQEGELTFEAVTLWESVMKYLKGTGAIAGIRMHPSQEVMSFYEAKKKDLLTPGIALVLLEAQAATGWIIDPIRNKILTVDEASREKVIGPDIHETLLSAERAAIGYTDPYTDATISLFEAMQEELIPKDHGIRLLEAQIATGGIIDPVHSHRVPVQVAYQRGYFDEEMNVILSDADDDTKGFFDPNTQDNLTYLQLIERCVIDPHTGLVLLSIVKKGEFYFFVDEATKLILKSKTTNKAGGKYKGLTPSNSRHFISFAGSTSCYWLCH